MKKLILILLVLLLTSPAWGHKITVTFTYPETTAEVGGFNLYDNRKLVCSTEDPTVRVMVCDVALGFGVHSFTMTAVARTGEAIVESIHSEAYPIILELSAPGLGSVNVED
jgi:hypothetical protein